MIHSVGTGQHTNVAEEPWVVCVLDQGPTHGPAAGCHPALPPGISSSLLAHGLKSEHPPPLAARIAKEEAAGDKLQGGCGE